jgi:membrane-associated phospholipid phosphatase
VFRFCNMRDLEHGKSMPSGDAAAAAYFCAMYFYLFNFPWFLPCIVLCSLGRVYVHCHWIGDTVIGSLIGLLFTWYWFSESSFGLLSLPLFKFFVAKMI